MNIRDEELLNRYFERQMSNSEEQNFLIDVAARDDMRVAFRSQLELLKAVRRDKDAMAGAAFVRERTLGALGFAGVVIPAALADDEAVAAPVAMSKWRSLLHKPLVLISGGLLVGSIATYSVVSTQQDAVQTAPVVSAPISQPEDIYITTPTEAPVQNIAEPQQTAKGKVESPKRSIVTNSDVKPSELKSEQGLPVINTSEPASVTVRTPQIKKPSESAK